MEHGTRNGVGRELKMVRVVVMVMMVMTSMSSVEAQGESVRLVNGTTNNTGVYLTGRVQLQHDQFWKTLCDTSLDASAAIAICRTLGYQQGLKIRNGIYGNGTERVYPGVFTDCALGAKSLAECYTYSLSPAPDFCASAGLVCFNETKDVLTLRLVDGKEEGKTKIGRLEAGLADLGWGSVCDSYINSYSADLACQYMGFKYGEMLDSMSPTDLPTQHFAVRSVYCGPFETNIFDCEHQFKAYHTCSADRYVALKCVGVSVRLKSWHPSILDAGNLEVYVPRLRSWYEVCDDGWDDMDASVVCRELGYVDGKALCCNQLGAFQYGSWDVIGVYNDVNCIGNETEFYDCNPTSPGGFCDVDDNSIMKLASVICYQNQTQKNLGFAARLYHSGQETSSQGYGRVQVRRYGFWGDVCPESFTDKEAQVACRMVGYTGGRAAGQGYTTQEFNDQWSRYDVYAELPVWISDVSCSGTESSLEECQLGRWGSPNSYCTESAYVICYNTELKLQLPDPSLYHGRLQVVFDGVVGSVCAEGFGDHSANIACRTMGFLGGNVLPGALEGTAVQGPVYISDVKCGVEEDSLFHCDNVWNNASQSCQSPDNQAAVVCYREVELNFGVDRRSGMVVVHNVVSGDELGKVCSGTFDDLAAGVVCRQLGFQQGYALPPGVYGQKGRNYRYMADDLDGVQCAGTESSLMDCPINSTADVTCLVFSVNYASVSCFTMPLTEDKYQLSMGPLEGSQTAGQVKIFYKQTWGYVCDQDWGDAEASVLCRQLSGQMGGVAIAYPGTVDGPFFITETSCVGTEASLDDCTSMSLTCNGYTAPGVLCYKTSAPVVSMVAEGVVPGRGRVQVAIDGEVGVVCGDNWTDDDAAVTCKSNGYKDGIAVMLARSSSPVMMSGVKCAGSEDSLLQCSSDGWRRLQSAKCMSDAGVMCFHDVKLMDGEVTDKAISGILHIRLPSGKFYRVCDGITSMDVSRACADLGFTDGSLLKSVKNSVVAYSVSCNGSETSLVGCNPVFNVCFYAARIVCFNQSSTESWQWRIKNGYHGEVEVTHQGVTGVICGEGWDDTKANLLCVHSGFTGGVALGPGGDRISFPDFVWAGSVTCPDNSQDMSQCAVNTTVPSSCVTDSSPAAVLCYNVSAPRLTLADGSNGREGRVQIEYDGVNGTVCDVYWSGRDAVQLCRQLGFADGDAIKGSRFGSGSGPVYMSRFRCGYLGSGEMGQLLMCPSNGWNNVSTDCLDHSKDAGVICYEAVKLGLNESVGPVLYFTDNYFQLVCADNFDDNAATVVCRQLGFLSGKALYPGAFGNRAETMGVGGVNCLGTEDSFQACQMDTDSFSCSSSYASVVCSGQQETGAYRLSVQHGEYGPVMIHHFAHDGYVCSNDYDDNDAKVICAEIGYPTGFAYHSPDPWRTLELHWLDNLNCTGTETRLDQCMQGNNAFDLGKYSAETDCSKAGAFCANTQDQVNVTWRLVGNSTTPPTKGHVEVQINGTWGSVCALGFGEEEAYAVCRTLGYISGNILVETFGPRSVPAWVNLVGCHNNEVNVMDCDITLGNHQDMCVRDATVQCTSGVRVTNDQAMPTTRYGRVEVRNETTGWTGVCSAGFTNRTADLACQDLGHRKGYYLTFMADVLQQRLFGEANVTCSSSATSFRDCIVTVSETTVCPDASYVFLFCSDDTNPPEALQADMESMAGAAGAVRYGFKGGICGKDFGNNEANVFCKEKGYQKGYALKAFKRSSQPLVLSKLQCTGSETKLSMCFRGVFVSSITDCPDGTAAHVLCSNSTEEVTYRLNPNNASLARAEVKIDGRWRVVSGDGFSDDEANVFCRKLGYASGDKADESVPGLPQYPIGVGYLSCLGNETSWFDCQGSWQADTLNDGSSTSLAFVTCYRSVRLIRGSTQSVGMVMYRRNQRWGLVCNYEFDDLDAKVVCRELGYSNGKSICCTPYGDSFYAFNMARVGCLGHETSIEQCPHSVDSSIITGCHYFDYASVLCYNGSDTQDYELSFPTGANHTGPVQVTYMNATGRICNDSWDDADARVACREMGFQNGQAYSHYRSNFIYSDFHGPFWSSEFQCTGNEQRLRDCPHVAFGNVSTCKDEHMAGALCYSQGNETIFRLTGNLTTAGRVEVRVSGVWGAICNSYWDDRDASVFCKSQGYTGGAMFDDVSQVGNIDGPVFRSNMRCQGTETDLNQCVHEGWRAAEDDVYCEDPENAAGAVCFSNVRLSHTPGADVYAGPLLLHHRDNWSLVCDSGFDDTTAQMTCLELGYRYGRAICCSAYKGALLNEQMHSGVQLHCTGQENSLDACIMEQPCLSGFYASVVCARDNATLDDSTYSVMLPDSSTMSSMGKLQVENMGLKGRICAINWTDENSEVFCKSQGYTSGFSYIHSDRYDYLEHYEIGPYLLSNVSCVGNESSLLDCPYQGRLHIGNCSTGHSAAVVCYTDSGIKYQLVDGMENFGRVELAIDNQWGTICDDMWDNVDATVMCRQLGFVSGIAVGESRYGQGSGTVWLKNVQCTGNETAIHRCPHSGFFDELDTSQGWWFFEPPCNDHEEDAGVFCFGKVRLATDEADATMGGLWVHHNGEYMAVCDDTFTNTEATLACKSLGREFQYGVVIKGSAFGKMEDVTMGITSIQCSGSETNLTQCTIHDTGTCQSGHYASIACNKTQFPSDDYQVRITNDTFSTDKWGIVEILDNGVWKRICHQGWDDKDASVVCRELGFKGGVMYTHLINHPRPIAFREFSCQGDEASLRDCPKTTTPDLENCAYEHYDAAVVCYNDTGISYNLAGGNNASEGRVEVIYDGQAGAVCNTYFTYNDSRVVCRSLNYEDGMVISRSELTNPPDPLDFFFINAPFCKGEETSLLHCLNSGFNSSFLGSNCFREAYASCYSYQLAITDIRVVLEDGSAGTTAGRVEVYLSGPNQWGTVCDDYWDDLDATVACVQLGFLWGTAVVDQTYGEGSGPIWLDNLECYGNETALQDCIHSGFGTHNCRHSEDAGVICYNTPKTTPPVPTTMPPITTQPPTTKAQTTPPPPPTTPPPTTPPPTTPPPTTPPPTTTTPAPVTQPATTPPQLTTATSSSTQGEGETSEQKSAETGPIVAGIAVGVIVLIIIIVVVVIVMKRRQQQKGIKHQRFSDEVMSGGQDGSIAMHNQMYDGNLAEAAPGSKYMAEEGEITLGEDRAVYQAQPIIPDSGFNNPLYSVMQPFRAENTAVSGQQNGATADSNGVSATKA